MRMKQQELLKRKCILHVRLQLMKANAISTAFAKKVGKQSLRIENIIDPSLIGGIRLQIGNTYLRQQRKRVSLSD